MFQNFRQPQYTGQNRCYPCTLINLIIGLALSTTGALILNLMAGRNLALIFGVAILLGSSAFIWLRGYLVPGTPQITAKYFPKSLLKLFGKTRTPAGHSSTDVSIDIEEFLIGVNAIEECEDEDDLCLTATFKRDWKAGMRDLDDTSEYGPYLESLGIDQSVKIQRDENAVIVKYADRAIAHWPSDVALIADLAASLRIDETTEGWSDFDVDTRSQVLSGLRVFLDECPDGDSVEFREEVVESCCSSTDVVRLLCSDSEKTVLEQPIS